MASFPYAALSAISEQLIRDIESSANTPEKKKVAEAIRRNHLTGEYDPRQWAFLEKCRKAHEETGHGIVVTPEDREIFDLLCECQCSLIKTNPGTRVEMDDINEITIQKQTTRITSYGLQKLKEHEIKLGTYKPVRRALAPLEGKIKQRLPFLNA